MTKHLDVHEVSPRTRVSTVVSTLAQIGASKSSEPGLETAGGWGIPTTDRPQCWLTHDSFCLFRLNCFWWAFAQDLCHSGRNCFILPQAQTCGASPLEAQPQPWQRRAPAIGSNPRQTVTLMRAATAPARPAHEPNPGPIASQVPLASSFSCSQSRRLSRTSNKFTWASLVH